MSVYVVTVDLDRLGTNYSVLRKKLFALHALQAQGSVWLVRYDSGADALRDHLQTDLDQNDRLFVAALNDEWATFNMAPSRRWLEEAGPLSAP
ncbi:MULTISPECIES: hypothetical protein [Pseudorhizobium]|nr:MULTISPECIES: hypothetical protein [Pseudorhizobium]